MKVWMWITLGVALLTFALAPAIVELAVRLGIVAPPPVQTLTCRLEKVGDRCTFRW